MPILIDAHEDLAYNMLTFGRDYRLAAAETRRKEAGTQIPTWSYGNTLLGWPEYQAGQVALVFGTLFAAPARRSEGAWDHLAYRDASQARQVYSRMLDTYLRLTDSSPEYFHLVTNRAQLAQTLADWQTPLPETTEGDGPAGHSVGLVVSMEGAEGVLAPVELEEWWQRGLRLIGPTWVSGNIYAGGNGEPGGLTRAGVELLEVMASIGFGLDLSHLDPQAAAQALDIYPGVIIASHANPAALIGSSATSRQLSDELIRRIVERDGVIGIVPYNIFLKEGWTPWQRDAKQQVTLADVVAHIDHVCQIAGDARHVAIGTDFDGGIGVEYTPAEIDTIADIQKLEPLLREKGYTEEDVAGIYSQNWVSILQRVLPDA